MGFKNVCFVLKLKVASSADRMAKYGLVFFWLEDIGRVWRLLHFFHVNAASYVWMSVPVLIEIWFTYGCKPLFVQATVYVGFAWCDKNFYDRFRTQGLRLVPD